MVTKRIPPLEKYLIATTTNEANIKNINSGSSEIPDPHLI